MTEITLRERTAALSFNACFAILMAAIFAAFAYAYLGHPRLPGNASPDGWFVVWDQSMYRRAARALTELDFGPTSYFYPPLFPWLGAPFVRWMPNHAFLIPCLVCLGVHLYGVTAIGERYFGRAVTFGAIAVVFLTFPRVTLEQWVIPWNSSLVGALSSVLFLLFMRFATKPRPWAIETSADHAALYGFYLAYGAVFATRPLDVMILFPLAFIVAGAVLWRIGPSIRLLPICAGISVAGLFFPLVYFALNYYAFGEPLGAYIHIARTFGMVIGPRTIERIVSLWVDKDGIYPYQGHSISMLFPPFVPLVALTIGAIISGPIVIRMIAFTAVLQLIAYTAFADLSPLNLFWSNMVHYFKTALPWLAVIGAGQAVNYLRNRMWLPLGTVALTSAVVMSIRVDAVPVPTTSRIDGGSVTASLSESVQIDVLDIPISGGFGPSDEQLQSIFVDGREWVRPREAPSGLPGISAMRAPWGMRFFFIYGITAQQVRASIPPPFKLASDQPPRLAVYRFTIACVVPRCVSR